MNFEFRNRASRTIFSSLFYLILNSVRQNTVTKINFLVYNGINCRFIMAMAYTFAKQYNCAREFGFKHTAEIIMVPFVIPPRLEFLESIRRVLL